MSRILHVIEASATGTLSMVVSLSNFHASKHDVTIIYSVRPETPLDFSTRFDSRINLIDIQMTSAKHYFSALFRLVNVYLKCRAEVIILHSSKAGFLGRIAALLSTTRPRVFYMPHSISFMRQDISAFVRRQFVMLERFADWVYKGTYLCCSKSEELAIRSALPSSHLQVLENAVAIVEDLPSSSFNTPLVAVMTVVTVGQIRRQKNPELFSKICAEMKSRRDIRFLWVGDGDAETRTILAAVGVEVTGWKKPSEVYEILLNSNIYLSTSDWEGMPISILEAMSFSLPIVAKSCAGNTDVVSHGVNGFLFDDLDSGILFLDRIVSDTTLISAFSKASRELQVSRFSLPSYLERFDHIVIHS